MRLQGKVAMVTGAASGIGRATATRMVEEGAAVVCADIDAGGAERTASALGERALAVAFDVAHESGWEQAMRGTLAQFGRLDILANVAGMGIPGSIEEVQLADWERMVAVNLTGVLLGCKHAVRTIRASGGAGAIINVSSLAGLIGTGDLAGYTAAKGGVTTLSKSVAMHCAEQGLPIRCISVHPTYVDTGMLDPIAEAVGGRAAMLAAMSAQVPMGRVAQPLDVANTIVFLASDEAAMISGSAVLVDGAQLAGPRSVHS